MSTSRFLFLLLSFVAYPVAAVGLQGTEWKPLRMGEHTVPEESSAFVRFRSKGRLGGFSGCNSLFAEYQATADGHLFIGPVAATRKACADSVMLRESRLAIALENARTYQRQGIRLVLFNDRRQPILELRQNDWD